MYSIGEFSKIGSVSAKTLRYYDEIGLLHPAYVDEDNHYRYYSEEQVDEILFIAELKMYSLRLEQIKAVMERKDQSLLEHFLKERVEQLESEMQASIRLKVCIEKKVHEIQLGGKNMSKENEVIVEAKEFEPAIVMSKRGTIQIEQIGSLIGKVFEDIYKNGMSPAGPVMTFYEDEEFHPEHANVEVCVPVSGSEEKSGVDGVKKLQPGLCATATYVGAYSKLGKAYAAVLKWIEENEYHISSAPFDCYISNPQDVKDPNELVTQVWFPISK